MKTRAGIGTQTIAAVAIVVLIVVVAGAYFALSGANPNSSGTTTSSTTEQSTSTPTSSVTTSNTSTSSVASTSSTSKVSTQSGTSQAAFAFTMAATPAQAVLSPGVSTNYMVLTVYPLASGSETVSLNGTASNGVGVSLQFPSLTLSGGAPQTTQVFLSASNSANAGNYTVTVTGASGGQVQSTSIPVRVVQHLVYLSYYVFNPTNVTVPTGSTVYFYNTDSPHSWCGEDDSGNKIISFTSIVSTTSPTISSFSLWSITLVQGGTYTYMDTLHPTSGTGTIVVD